MRIACLLLLVLGTASTGALSADVYTCKENGKTVLQGAPCAFVQDQIAKHRAVENTVPGFDQYGFRAIIAAKRARIKEEEKNLTAEEKHERKMARMKEAARTFREQQPKTMTCRPSMLGDGALNCE